MSQFAQLSPAEQAIRLDRLARVAITRWPLDCVCLTPIKVRENAVYAVQTAGEERAVLRVHRYGYHSDEALQSELAWMRELAECGIEVPRPIASRAGRLFELVELDGVQGPHQVDVFEWIDGHEFGSVEHGLNAEPERIAEIYGTLGELTARMHNHSSTWQLPASFSRHSWSEEGLAGETPLWGRFWELRTLSPAQRALFERLRAQLAQDLRVCGKTPDRFGLIHADLIPENILVDAGRVRIIDFDDAGFGWHMFDMATSLYFIRRESFYEQARDALFAGYRRHRALPDAQVRLLPMFLAARGSTYLGWVHTRSDEATAWELTPELVRLGVAAADDYLTAQSPRR